MKSRQARDKATWALHLTLGAVCLLCAALASLCGRLLRHAVELAGGRGRLREGGGRPVLVTGCDFGMGQLLAERLHVAGFEVLACCLTEQGRDRWREERFDGVLPLLMDVTDDESVARCAERVSQHLRGRRLHGVVNNAGVLQVGLMDYTDVTEYQRMMNVNYLGVVRVVKAFWAMLERDSGRIVNLSSVAGLFSAPTMSAYSASKFAVEAFTDSVRRELQPFGISVHLVEPIYVVTPMTANAPSAMKRQWDQSDERVRRRWGESFFQEMLNNFMETNQTMGIKPAAVIDTLMHALASNSPRVRYRVGFGGWGVVAPLGVLPGEMYDAILSTAARLKGAPLPACLQK